jgi:hypothetical protein
MVEMETMPDEVNDGHNLIGQNPKNGRFHHSVEKCAKWSKRLLEWILNY